MNSKQSELLDTVRVFLFLALLALSLGVCYNIWAHYFDDNPELITEYRQLNSVELSFTKQEQSIRHGIAQQIIQKQRSLPQSSDTLLRRYGINRADILSTVLNDLLDSLQSADTIQVPTATLERHGLFLRFFKGRAFSDLTNLNCTLRLNKAKLKEAIGRTRTEAETTDAILFSDYFEKAFEFEKSLSVFRIVVTISILLFGLIIWSLLPRMVESLRGVLSPKKMADLDRAAQKAEDELKLSEAKVAREKLSDEVRAFTAKTFSSFHKELNELKALVDQYHHLTDAEICLDAESIRLLTRAEKIYRVANRMLVFGLTVSAVGIVFFYLTLPEAAKTVQETLLRSVRPVFVLLFIESIAFYLLKQHRKLLDDYKYFVVSADWPQVAIVALKLDKEDKTKYSSIVRTLLRRLSQPTVQDKDEGSDTDGSGELVKQIRDLLNSARG